MGDVKLGGAGRILHILRYRLSSASATPIGATMRLAAWWRACCEVGSRCVRIAEHDGEGTALLAALQALRQVWLIDAAQSGVPPGTIRRIDCSVTNVALPPGTVSCHGFGLVEAIALARALDLLPRQ